MYGSKYCMAMMHAHLESQSSVGDLGGVTGVDGQRSGKLDRRGKCDDVNSIHFVTNSCVCMCVWLHL